MIAFALPIARLCLAIVFLYSGVDKLWHWRSSVEEVRSDGLPWPTAFAGATVFTQLVGGCLVATGSSHGWAHCCSPALRSRLLWSGIASGFAGERSSGTS
jgi:hypothetical protein